MVLGKCVHEFRKICIKTFKTLGCKWSMSATSSAAFDSESSEGYLPGCEAGTVVRSLDQRRDAATGSVLLQCLIPRGLCFFACVDVN